MRTRKQLSITGILILLLINSLIINAQLTLNDAIELYNNGVQLLEVDKNAAIAKFEECITICNEIGAEADETRLNLEAKLPVMYYDVAFDTYKEKKYQEAITKFEKTIEIAEKYGDDNIKNKSQDVISKLYYSIGNSYFKNKEYDDALSNYNKATEINPQYTKAYYYIGIIYKAKDDMQNMLKAMDKTIESGLANNEPEIVEKANNSAKTYLLKKANTAKQAEDYDTAIDLLNKSLSYDNKYVEAHYLLAVIYNKKSSWDSAIKAANLAIDAEEGGNDEKARLYYELGNALAGKGDNTAACNAYGNAAFGDYTDAAKYQMEHVLKCN